MKRANLPGVRHPRPVAPRTGAWIETAYLEWLSTYDVRRPPHGGVD